MGRLVVALDEEYVRRLEIPVHDARAVGLVEREGRLVHVGDGLEWRDRADALDALAEIHAAQELHHEEGHPRGLVHAGVEDVDDVHALHLGRDARLALEALA